MSEVPMRLAVGVGRQDHQIGPDSAPVTLVEYGDYECPYCGEAAMVVTQLLSEFGARIRFVFRNLPLRQLHPHAQRAAQAAEAVALQHRFWEMHDLLFANQDQLGEEALLGFAGRAGADPAEVAAMIDSEPVLARVQGDLDSAARSGATGTPCFFVNDWRYDGPWDLLDLSQRIAEELTAI